MIVRVSITFILAILGFLLPVWVFLFLIFLASLWFRNYWEIFIIMVVLNSVYVYNKASFEALYLVWGLGIYVISWFIHTRTRFNNYLAKE
jgi:hypothetical protein